MTDNYTAQDISPHHAGFGQYQVGEEYEITNEEYDEMMATSTNAAEISGKVQGYGCCPAGWEVIAGDTRKLNDGAFVELTHYRSL